MTDTDTNPETARRLDEQAWEEALIADLRANGGRPSDGPLKGHPIIVMYSTGAKNGERRRSVLTISTDGDAYVVAGTAGGSEHTPAWVANLEAHPDIQFEFGDQDVQRPSQGLPGWRRARPPVGRACPLPPHFAAYPEQTGRVIPMARIVTTSRRERPRPLRRDRRESTDRTCRFRGPAPGLR